MKKANLLILIYTLIVAALVASVKMAQTYITGNHTDPKALIADCSDSPPQDNPGE